MCQPDAVIHENTAFVLLQKPEAFLSTSNNWNAHGEKHAKPIGARTHRLELRSGVFVHNHAYIESAGLCPCFLPIKAVLLDKHAIVYGQTAKQKTRQRVDA